jgi:hypothetical protein
MSNATKTGTTQIDDSTSVGIVPQGDGTFLALGLASSKTFRTVKGAAAWLAKRGYGPTGARLAVVSS